MKLLIVGAQGQVARSLIEIAEERGVDFLAQEPPELDLTAPDTIEKAIEEYKPDYVINAAAYTAVDKAEEGS